MAFYVKLNKPIGLIILPARLLKWLFVDVWGHRSMTCGWVFRFFFILIFIFIIIPLFSVIDLFSSSKPSSRTKNTKWHMLSSVSFSWRFVHLMQQNLTELLPSPNNPFSETSRRTILNIQESILAIFDFFLFFGVLQWVVFSSIGICFLVWLNGSCWEVLFYRISFGGVG